MSTRRAVPAFLASAFALLFFGLGNYLGARQNDSDEQLAALRAEVALLKHRVPEPAGTTGKNAGADLDDENRAAIVADVKRQLADEMGLLPLDLLRERRESFVELYSYDDRGSSSYGTAGYLGNGYFITVKHGVVALGQEGLANPRRIVTVKLMYKGRMIPARVIDAGEAQVEVDPGDWAIVKVKEAIDLPALNLNLAYGFDFADPIFRLGNDYSKGIILSTGYVGQRMPNGLVTCLTDGHPGVSGGGVLDQRGDLVGIPIGRMQGDYRFSFILPIRAEMFRKIPQSESTPLVLATTQP
jgi:S1-C subfamily serine protease